VIEMFIGRPTKRKWFALCLSSLIAATSILLASAPPDKTVQVMTSGGFSATLIKLLPDFEKETSIRASAVFGASMGNTLDAIPNRLARGETADLVILTRPALDELVKTGKVIPGSQVDLVLSNIGMVVRAGAPKPDISTVTAFKRALLDASSIAYSDSASGVYISTEMFKNLGIADQVLRKSRKIEGERVAAVVARGDAEIGFQQISELLLVPGADYVGPLPAEVQRVTIFSAGIPVGAKHPDAARTLIAFLRSPAAVQAIKDSGLEPIAVRKRGARVETPEAVPSGRRSESLSAKRPQEVFAVCVSLAPVE
jgi:molybdate transport system substrate-binding protein